VRGTLLLSRSGGKLLSWLSAHSGVGDLVHRRDERLIAYDLHGLKRNWEDYTDAGIHNWQRGHNDLMVMSAKLELAAWNLRGNKHWSTLAEPSWRYHLKDDMVHLDVPWMVSSFSLLAGPIRP
jgi:hypothetical protein